MNCLPALAGGKRGQQEGFSQTLNLAKAFYNLKQKPPAKAGGNSYLS